jgi:hypothetical protein
MQVIEKKEGDQYKYEVPMKEGVIEYYSEKPIRAEKTEKLLDEIFMIIINKPNGEGNFSYKEYNIRYNKKIEQWIK